MKLYELLGSRQIRDADRREETFVTETFAQDETDQFPAPKVFTNAKQYSIKGEAPFYKFNRNEAGIITDNLIIKGNNLLALHSIKEVFAGKIKLIYIDPPYNTGSNSFRYKDSFSQSAWLTFMRNRLQVAWELLSDEGAIYAQIDHHQLGYLHVLLDDIFGKENKVQIIAVKTASPAGFKTVNPGPVDVTEYILFYTKNRAKFKFKKGYVPVGYNTNYNLYVDKDNDISKWTFTPIKNKVIAAAGFASEAQAKKNYGELWSSILKAMIEDFAYKNATDIVSIRDPHKPVDKLKALLTASKKEKKVIAYQKKDGNIMYLYKGGALAFYSNKMQEVDGRMEVTELLTDFWNHISWAGIANEGGVKFKNGKKPEKLIKQIIELATEENDIVLDYYLGSGTTAAVAHKLKRQYIGLELLDYGVDDSVVRLKNVIAGDATGISKTIKWNGGGAFVYLELKKCNQDFVAQIESAKNTQTLLEIRDQMKAKFFLNYNLDLQKQEEYIAVFRSHSLAQQKKHLISILDNNQFYINCSSLHDKYFSISKEEKEVTIDFYRVKK